MRTLLFLSILLCSFSIKAQKTNVIFILVDDLKPTINAFGASQMITPNLDAFASESVVFTNTQAQQAVCAASRVSFMTGMRPDYTQVLDLKTHMRDKVPNSLTIPEYFKQNGYQTVGLGKVLHGAKNNDPQSWTIPFINDDELPYNIVVGAPADFQYQNSKTKKIYDELMQKKASGVKLKIRPELKKAGARPSTENEAVPDDAYVDGAIAIKSIELIDEFTKNSVAFFLTIGFRKPHLPFVAPKKYWNLYNRENIELAVFQEHAEGSPKYAYHSFGELKNYSDIKANLDEDGRVIESKQRELIHGYYASVSYVDAQIGLVIDYLKESGLYDSTLIVLIGDHGWHLGDHGLWNKHSNFEQATRTPMIVKNPNNKKALKNASPTELIDVFPTMCDIVGLDIPSHLQGQSLVPIINGNQTKVNEVALSQYPRNGKMGYAIRSDRYRYVEWREGDYKKSKDYINGNVVAVELYDYEKDPLETKNLANNAEYTEVVQRLKLELDNLLNK